MGMALSEEREVRGREIAVAVAPVVRRERRVVVLKNIVGLAFNGFWYICLEGWAGDCMEG